MPDIDIPTYGYAWLIEVDWDDDGLYAHALSDVTERWLTARYAYGTARRSNPQRPTVAAGRGTITLIGNEFVPGLSTVFTAAQLQTRHRLRFSLGSMSLWGCWLQEARHAGRGTDGGVRTQFSLEGLLERPGRAQQDISQIEPLTSSTAAEVLALAQDAYGLTALDHNLTATPLGVYTFAGPAARYVSQFAQVAGALPVALRAGGLGLYDPTTAPLPLPSIYRSVDYVIESATTEFDSEQLFTSALVEYEREGIDTDLTAFIVVRIDRRTSSTTPQEPFPYTIVFTLPAPPAGASYEDIGVSVGLIQAGFQDVLSGVLVSGNGLPLTVFINPIVTTTESTVVNQDGTTTVSVTGMITVANMETQITSGFAVGSRQTGWWLLSYDFSSRVFMSNVRVPIILSYTLRRASTILNEEVFSGGNAAWGMRELTFPPWFSSVSSDAVEARIEQYAKPRDIHVLDFAMQQADTAMSDAVANLEAGDFIGILVEDPRTRTEISGFVFVMNVAYNLHRNRPPVKRLTCLQTGVPVVRIPVIFAINDIPLAINDVVLGVNG